jgi:hypothetical protein
VAHEPHRIAFYLYDLASEFHALWTKGRDLPYLRFIINNDAEITKARLALVQGVVSVLASGLAVLGVHAPTRCGRQGRRPLTWGSVGHLAGATAGSFVMAGWRFPEGDASSRWLIDIRTDLFPPTTTTIAAVIQRALRGRERSAGRAGAADRADRSVRRRGQRRQSASCSRAPTRARNTDTAAGPCETRRRSSRRPAAVDAARRAAGSRRRKDFRSTSRARCIRCTATRPACAARAGVSSGAAICPTQKPQRRSAAAADPVAL